MAATRVRIVHRIVYRFDEMVRGAKLDLRLRPQDGPTQTIEHQQIIVDPRPARRSEERDVSGNLVTRVELDEDLASIEISAVTTARTWPADVTDEARAEHAELRALLADVGIVAGAGEKTGPGACRARTEVAIAALAARGVATRYVSGYVFSRIGARADAHAWLSVRLPSSGAWVDFDPTVGAPTGERHVRVAAGDGYSDVAPVSGAVALPSPPARPEPLGDRLGLERRFSLASTVHVEVLPR